MDDSLLKVSLLTATTFTGLLCGASLDQSIKQLPARHVIGVKAFSEYAKAADLKNGVPFYAVLGIGAALSSIVTAILVLLYHAHDAYGVPIILGGVFAICHSICTSQAAPTYFRQKKLVDADELEKLFNRFEMIQTFRTGFIVLNVLSFVTAIWLMT